MKIVFEFQDDEQDYAEMAFRGRDYYCAISNFENYLRSKWKYDDNLTEDQQKLIEEIRLEFYNTFGKLLDD